MDERRLRPSDFASAADLLKLPLMTRHLLRTHANDLRARNIAEGSVTWTRTGGTTGEPLRVAKDEHCAMWEGMSYERGLQWGGLAVDSPRVRLFGGSLGIGRVTWRQRLGRSLRGELFLPAFELRIDTARGFLDRIKRSRARHIIGYASAIFRLASLARELGQDLRFDAAFPTAELLLPEWKETVRDVFRCEVLPYYGCGEVNSLGFTARGQESYLIPEEQCLVEVLGADGTPAFHGEGAFALTSLVNYAMPIVRYVNGDAGSVAPPADDFSYSRIVRLDGRYNSLLMTDSGDLISGAIGAHVFRHVTDSVESYRIVQEQPLHIVINVVPRDGRFSADDESLIRGLLTKHLGPRMEIVIERVTSIPATKSGKAVFVVNRCLENRFSR
jgi:phenylacetate-CoA ligase